MAWCPVCGWRPRGLSQTRQRAGGARTLVYLVDEARLIVKSILERLVCLSAPECSPALLPAAARPRAPRPSMQDDGPDLGLWDCGSGTEVMPGDLRDGSWGGLGRLSSEVIVIATDGWGRGVEGAGNGVIAGFSCPLCRVLRRLLYSA